MTEEELATKEAVDRLYEAYFAGDPEGMLATMSQDVHVRFLGRVDVRGIDEARAFFHANAGILHDLDFRIRKLIVDGRFAAAVWDESATTVHGEPWENHGVDVFEVVGGQVVAVHENNDVAVYQSHFGDT